MGTSKTKSNQLKTIGLRLRKIRSEKNITLKELGFIVDREPQSISRIEMGKTNPTITYLLELCEGLEIDISVLLKDLEEQ